MPGWDIEDEENPTKPEWSETETVGKEDYMIVLHYPRLRPAHFKPQHVEKDGSGSPVMNPFNKAQPKLEEGDPESVYRKLTHSWKTSKNDLDLLDRELKSVCNSTKSFLNKHKVAVFFHSSARDECAKYQGAHLHILYHSELTTSGKFQALWQRTEWTTITKKIKEVGGYAKCQGVKHLEGAMKHFATAPRMLLGTSYSDYGRILYRIKQDKVASVSFQDLLDDDDVDTEEPPICDFDDFCDQPPSPKRSRHDFGDNQQEFRIMPKSKEPYKIKESEKDAQIRLVSVLCHRWNAWTSKELFRKAGEHHDNPSEKPYVNLWFKLSIKSGIKQVVDNVKSRDEAITMHKPFAQLISEYCETCVETYGGDTGKLDPKESFKKMMAWLEWQNINPIQFIENVFDVMDKRQPKINTILMIGPPNSGKTSMFSAPIRDICLHVGQIGNRGANSEFIYQECINKRMIAIDECVMAPNNLEDLKLLTAGEKLLSNVKTMGYEGVARTPCIMTGNKEPWILDTEAGPVFAARMLRYDVHACRELENIKGMSPKMWWYMMEMKVHGSAYNMELLSVGHPEVGEPGNMTEDDLN